MAGRIVRGHFDAFAQSRLAFVRAIADLSERPEYLESLLAEDAFGTLKPMLHDKIATVQQTAALALGRMAGCSVEISIELVKAGASSE
jgi:HEAT repeat protein